MHDKDKNLGMDRHITRRDFLNGTSIAVTGSLFGNPLSAALDDTSAQRFPGYYPPTRTGMRGSHVGSFELAHRMRDGETWGDAVDTGEEFDLVVVGGGISGLATAYFYQKSMGPNARILVIDNHDDFGGHAKRNEFHYRDRMLVDLGGTEFIESPLSYPPNASALIKDLGIDISRADEVFDHDLYPSLGLRGGVFFDRENFGEDKTVAGREGLRPDEQQNAYITLPAELDTGVGNAEDVSAFLERTPLSQESKAQVLDLFCGNTDYLEGKSLDKKISLLRSISYVEFLSDYAGASTETIAFFKTWRTSYMGDSTDLVMAMDALSYGLPGASGLGLVSYLAEHGYQPRRHKEDLYFPDGNASIARMLVRRLVPDIAPGNSMDDIVSAKFDYNLLDEAGSPVTIRLNSTAVRVNNTDDGKVEVVYVEGSNAERVQSKHCVLACYHAIVPYICPGLPRHAKRGAAQDYPYATGLDQRACRQLAVFREPGHLLRL